MTIYSSKTLSSHKNDVQSVIDANV